MKIKTVLADLSIAGFALSRYRFLFDVEIEVSSEAGPKHRCREPSCMYFLICVNLLKPKVSITRINTLYTATALTVRPREVTLCPA